MADLKERLQADMVVAMKEREAGKGRLAVIRLVRSGIKDREINTKTTVDDAGVIEIIMREIKQRREVIPDYEKANRPEVIERLQNEILILESYLPQQLSEDALRAIIVSTIASVHAHDLKDLGKVMGALMPRVKGQAEGALINRIVREELAK